MSEEVNLILEGTKFVGTLLAAGGGAWLSVRFLPLKAKKDEWQWKKRIEAQELVFNTLSEISFVAHNYIKSEYADKVSMSGKNFPDSNDIVFGGTRLLHEKSAGLSLLLSEAQSEYLEEFLSESQKALDEAGKTWGQWEQGDHFAETDHISSSISELGVIAESCLNKLKKSIESVYK